MVFDACIIEFIETTNNPDKAIGENMTTPNNVLEYKNQLMSKVTGYNPEWLLALVGIRELEILATNDWRVEHVDPDHYGEERLPKGVYYIVSPTAGNFGIDANRRMIIG